MEQIKIIEKVMQDPDLTADQLYFVKISNAYYLSALRYNQQNSSGEMSNAQEKLKVKGRIPLRRLNT